MSTAPSGRGVLRIVLADDTPEIRDAIRLSLAAEGRFEVVGEAADGRSAVHLVARERPHVVLLDLAMPVMDGLEAIPLIRRVAPDTKVVILSGFAAERMGRRAIEQGADLYITKGVSFRRIADALVGLCGGRPVVS